MSLGHVIVIGGGVAGLNCARSLQQAGQPFLLLEASDAVGGRVRTDEVEGFRLDRGFQVFQTAYPEAQLALSYDALDLRELEPGALVRKSGGWVTMCDPWRRPSTAFSTLFNSIGTFGDRLRLLRLVLDCLRGDEQHQLGLADEQSTFSLLLDKYRFSSDFLDSFLVPWLSGIFLESELKTSANFFRFVFRILVRGQIAYPAQGMGAISQQLARELPADRLRLNAPVQSLDEKAVTLESGERLECAAIVLATDVMTASRLTAGAIEPRGHTSTRCIYFAAAEPPVAKPILMLDGDGSGPLNHVFVASNASPAVAPPGRVLISASQVGRNAVQAYNPSAVRQQLRSWFGSQVDEWRQLRVYDLPHALPAQPAGSFAGPGRRTNLPESLFQCGDYCETASLNGALRSGRLAAESVLAYVHGLNAEQSNSSSRKTVLASGTQGETQ